MSRLPLDHPHGTSALSYSLVDGKKTIVHGWIYSIGLFVFLVMSVTHKVGCCEF